jgi:hypothetical protein
VLGFRRAPTAAQSFADQAKAAKDAAAEVARLLGEVEQIEGGFSPAAAAARKLADQFARLDEASGKGAISLDRALIDKVSLQNADLFKPNMDLFTQGAARFDEEMKSLAEASARDREQRVQPIIKAGRQLIDSFDGLKRAGEGFVDDVLNPDNWRSWGGFGKMILRDLAREAEQLALINPIKHWLFDDKGSGGGGIFQTLLSAAGNIFGAVSGSGSSAGSAGFAHEFGHNAAGTENWRGGMTWIAENGPELVSLPAGSRVRSAAETRRLMASNDEGSVVHQHFHMEGAVVTAETFWAEVDRRSHRAVDQRASGIAQQGAALAFDIDSRRYGRR